jgi:diacylglycerol diphosphate phosphatase/phosphatidate phosphatase
MKSGKTALLIFLLIASELPAGESLKVLPEVLEWGLTGAAFVGARKLDHMPAWSHLPIFKGEVKKPYRANTVTETELYAAAGLAVLGIGFIPNNDGWLQQSNYNHTQGFAETLSAVYLLTNITKNLCGRQRPSYLHYPKEDYLDADKSFPSGHTSISFAVASYTSLYVFDHIGHWNKAAEKSGKLLYFATSHLLAGFVGYTRIFDNRHFLSDVIAGGLLGSGVALMVYSFQNQQISSENGNSTQTLEVPLQLTFSIPF